MSISDIQTKTTFFMASIKFWKKIFLVVWGLEVSLKGPPEREIVVFNKMGNKNYIPFKNNEICR